MFISSLKRPRRGIILLVALGILALFGILAAAYLTFASNSRQAAFSHARQDFHAPKPERLMHEALMQVLVGTTDTTSPLFRHDLLGDYYGYHDTAMGVPSLQSERLAVRALRPQPTTIPAELPNRNRGVLGVGAKIVKVPLRFDVPQPPSGAQNVNLPENVYNSANLSSPLNFDDALAGRTVSFLEGPLEGHTLRIIRWTGFRDTGSPEFHMRYSLFVDFNDPSLPSTVVLADGTVTSLENILTAGEYAPACLFYSVGGDNRWGQAGQDEDGAGGTDDVSEAGFPSTDDLAYSLVVNPIPRNGTGTGIDASNGNVQSLSISVPTTAGPDFNTTPLPVAFQPNFSRWAPSVPTIDGNADERYDAPDYENFFLSSRQLDASGNVTVIPSFHRPALVNNMLNVFNYDLSAGNQGEIRATVEALRRAVVRPLAFHDTHYTGGENARFTGGNPNFILRTPLRISSGADMAQLDALVNALVNGPWDVDNDNDGEPDSIWLDLNLPLITAPDGKLIRPLVAIQIEDLAARFHLNAHGNVAQLTDAYLQRGNGPLAGKLQDTTMSAAASLAAGRGYGPAEIFPLLDVDSIDTSGAANSRHGRIGLNTDLFNSLDALFASRYSSDGGGAEIADWTVSGTVPEWQRPPSQQPGIRRRVPGQAGADLYDQWLHPAGPQIQTRFTRFGLPVDRYGRGGLGLDASGNLVSSAAGIPLLYNPNTSTSYMDESLNDPYEFDPAGRLNSDNALTLTQMERLLHRNSWDKHLYGSRAEDVLGDIIDKDPSVAGLVTTYSSSDVRSPSLPIPELRTDTSAHLASINTAPLVETLLSRVIKAKPNSQITQADLNLANTLLAPELRMGIPLNVNRHLGNGLDDNGNSVIDEPLETLVETNFANASQAPQYDAEPYRSYLVKYPNQPQILTETGHQALARHLYSAAMLLANSDDDLATRWITDTTHISTAADQQSYQARRIAQWAVNVVDYRDGDSIMTRFLYDENPFNGWDNVATEMKEVWGCEHPELLFMESVAFHSLGVKDTKNDSSGKDTQDATDPDENVDQIRRPQGSAFLEVFNPRPKTTASIANHEAVPTELYGTDASGNPVLDLDRQTPGYDSNNDGDYLDAGDIPPVPVWRIAISEPHIADKAEAEEDRRSPLEQRKVFTDTTSFDPSAPDELNLSNAPPALTLERFVVFNYHADRNSIQPLADAYNVDISAIFSNLTNVSTNLPLGTFLTVAPRTETRLGSLVDNGTPSSPSPQRFEMVAGEGLVHYDTAGTRVTPAFYPADASADALPAMVVPAQAFEPPAWGVLTAANRTELFGPNDIGIGFNISEPLPGASYYRMPEDYLMGAMGNFPRRDAYWDYSTGTSTGNVPPADDPLDLNQNYPVGQLTQIQSAGADDPYIGSVENYRTAFLQRLADPTLDYQPDAALPNYNPYRTVDWITMDLNVFTGDELEDTVSTKGNYYTESRTRTGDAKNSLFSNRLNDPATAPMGVSAIGLPYISLSLKETLSVLDATQFGARHNKTTVVSFDSYIGFPQTPFALHPWLNRPYDSPLELMWVPACSQGRLFEEFSVASTENFYEGDTVAKFRAPFGHLLNFFDSLDSVDKGAHLYRIFDYLGTGPKFRGSADPFAPGVATDPLGVTKPEAIAARDYWRKLLEFPSNQMPSFSEQGRVNLNTVGDPRVYAGLMWAHWSASQRATFASAPLTNPEWNAFSASRRGYAPQGTLSDVMTGARPYNYAIHLNPAFPTQFADRFTGATSFDLAPPLSGATPAWIGGTLLRPELMGNAYSPNQPLFLRGPSGEVFTTQNPAPEYENTVRSAVMAYQSLTRLPNLTTEHSNAYLIRMTMGFFEVDPAGLDLGREHLSDYGRNKRYRATYVVDRSIPCQYETGVENDAEKLILFQRFYSE